MITICSTNRQGVCEGNNALSMPSLQPIDWSVIGAMPPEVVEIPDWNPSESLLPQADYVVITWTMAEWNLLDFVFCDSSTTMPYYDYRKSNSWKQKWHPFAKDYPQEAICTVAPEENDSVNDMPAWGNIYMVSMNGKKVLLVKSSVHLSRQGLTLLESFCKKVVAESSPQVVFTIGTAGGAKVESNLGDVSITNAAELRIGKEKGPVYSNGWMPTGDIQKAILPLLRPVPATVDQINTLIDQINTKHGTTLSWADLVNKNIDPENLNNPQITFMDKTPVLTTKSYDIATTAGNFEDYAAMEMDDAVVAMTCVENHIAFAVARNISDPVVNACLDQEVAKDWAGSIYGTYGFYSSYNSAIATWAALTLATAGR